MLEEGPPGQNENPISISEVQLDAAELLMEISDSVDRYPGSRAIQRAIAQKVAWVIRAQLGLAPLPVMVRPEWLGPTGVQLDNDPKSRGRAVLVSRKASLTEVIDHIVTTGLAEKHYSDLFPDGNMNLGPPRDQDPDRWLQAKQNVMVASRHYVDWFFAHWHEAGAKALEAAEPRGLSAAERERANEGFGMAGPGQA
jgi:hypothetical protein